MLLNDKEISMLKALLRIGGWGRVSDIKNASDRRVYNYRMMIRLLEGKLVERKTGTTGSYYYKITDEGKYALKCIGEDNQEAENGSQE